MTQWAPIIVSTVPQLVLPMLIVAIVLSYKIERRSPELMNRSGYARWVMFPHTITNRRVARDPKTQSLRRIMLWLLATIAVLCVIFVVAATIFDQHR